MAAGDASILITMIPQIIYIILQTLAISGLVRLTGEADFVEVRRVLILILVVAAALFNGLLYWGGFFAPLIN